MVSNNLDPDQARRLDGPDLGPNCLQMTQVSKGVLAWYGKLTWESVQASILKILCYLIVWGINLIFMVRLSFYANPLLIYDVKNDITIIP